MIPVYRRSRFVFLPPFKSKILIHFLILGACILQSCQLVRNNSKPIQSSSNNTTENVFNLDTVTIKANKPVLTYQAAPVKLVDQLHTRLEVKFDWTKCYLIGNEILTFTPHFYPVQTLQLDARTMDIKEVALVKNEVKTPLDYTYKDDLLTIQLDKTYLRTDTVQLYIDYIAKPNERKKKGGSAAITDDKGLYFINPDGKIKNKPTQIWTQGETQSSSAWFPCIDRPNQKMTDELFITVSNKYTTLSNGELIDQQQHADGTRTDYWRMDLPQSTYLMMMAIGEFEIVKDKWRDKEVNYYVEKKYAPYARKIFGHTPAMMEFFSHKLQFPYVWNKYAQVVVRDYVSGAMENTTATLFGEFMNQTDRDMLDRDYEDVISHELFHHWFGDLVTCKSWSNLTLNESFADYSEYLWQEYRYGRNAADAHRHSSLNKYLSESKHKQVDLVRYFYDDKEDMFDATTYEKGGAILHMLRKYVGDSAFFASLHLYLENNKFQNAEVAQLRIAFETVTGEDLNWFFNQWYFASGHPNLEVNHNYDSIAHQYSLTIKQTQDQKTTPIFKIPIDIDIYTQGRIERKRIVIEKLQQEVDFEQNQRPDFVNVDAEKMLVGVKTETGKTPSDYLFEYQHAPLFEDRIEALFGLVNSPNTPQFKKAIISALADSTWQIRVLAISGLNQIPKGNEDSLKQRVLKLAVEDPKSLVRAEAINFLSNQYKKDRTLLPLLKDALSDPSYRVIGDAIDAINLIDTALAYQLAKTLETEHNESIRFSLMEIYAHSGNDSDNVYFESLADQFIGYTKAEYIQNYGDFLIHCNVTTLSKAVVLFDGFLKDENKIVKFYARKVLKDLDIKLQTGVQDDATKALKQQIAALLKDSQ